MESKSKIDVSIVIVCMNNLVNLYPCLESIKKFTTINYEVFVVAYMFSLENLQKLKNDYPWITIIESNKIRGFSENNNLALRKAKGEFCFILNDDTFFGTPVIDKLVEVIKTLPEDVAVLSPNIKFPDGRDQYCGVSKYDWKTFLASQLKIKYYKRQSRYVNQEGIFQSYNISGAAFLIKTDIFREIGFFDERFFFCPEDIAVSTKLNKLGYRCFVDANNIIYHIQGGTWSIIQSATMPAHLKGSLIFYSNNSSIKFFFLGFTILCIRLFYGILWFVISLTGSQKAKVMLRANFNVVSSILSNLSPKEIFIKYYSKI